MTKTIFFDMDGVLCDFVGGVRDEFNVPNDWSPKKYDFYKELNVTPEKFWTVLGDLGENFWMNLKPIKEGVDLFLLLHRVFSGNVFILTSPPLDVRVASWKLAWVQQNIIGLSGGLSRKVLVVPAEYKKLLSGQGRVLIDDSYKNCLNWAGESYLVKTSYTPENVKGHTFEEIKGFLFSEYVTL